MSYLHCPTCKRAFNLAVQATCPYCPVQASVVDPTEDIVVAAEQLARAMARATPAERGLAAARMDRLALPAPGDESARNRAPVFRQIRDVLEPPQVQAPAAKPALLSTIVVAVEQRLERLWSRHVPKRLDDGLRRVRARVKALAQVT
jgi:hypothetical protein